ncbi:hypothetical protein BABINDRAFT_168157 [Babjeviella inositovora NRRL Y-12698]|uniref:Protein YOP1 n=1 Tax=Babjeviella inositovora NRRL Y-12698 TaxID=984486 RepID=A0A1E3QMU5_9ASCO|nr:uncharacterized protein BABINDRAFT_168157 [Babjeviella inositovora NRRL Y-12698]ODQ78412.1 hypothetical protein BABINDRAFT_168157 [Babjeviella inositovora NRRL Y-12698]
MSDLQFKAKAFLTDMDRAFEGSHIFRQFEDNTGLPKSYGVLGGAGVYLFIIFLNVGGIGQLLSNIAGFVIPCYYSLLALETRTTADDTQLLTYWVVFAFLNVIEFWSKAILYWIPFYWLFKTIALLYLALPQFGGATPVYNTFIKPFSEAYIIPRKSVASNLANTVEEVAEGVSSAVEH